jgi:hypothetical protein
VPLEGRLRPFILFLIIFLWTRRCLRRNVRDARMANCAEAARLGLAIRATIASFDKNMTAMDKMM